MALELPAVISRWFGNRPHRPSREEDRLLHRCKGDHELKERLIGAELARRPGMSRAAASMSAVQRWERER
jgi:hypothetical protein